MTERQTRLQNADGDALTYLMQLEDWYGVTVIFNLRPAKVKHHWGWTCEAKAYEDRPNADRVLITMGSGIYPTNAHKTFHGAMMGALFELDDRLCAFSTLRVMGDTPPA